MITDKIHRWATIAFVALSSRARDVAHQLRHEDQGSVQVEYALVIGFVLLIAAAVLWPQLQQLFTALVAKWKVP